MELHVLNESGRNRQLLKYMLTHREVTRQELVDASGLTLLTVSKAVSALLEAGLLVVDGAVTGGMGRRKSLLKINPAHRYAICVDIGFASIKIGVVLFNGRILEKKILQGYSNPVSAGIPHAEMMAVIHEYLHRFGSERCLGIGASISGMVDFDIGRVLFCPNIHGFNERPLAAELSLATGLPVLLDTSARCMALAESYFGIGAGIQNQVFISLGIGSIAAGIILDKRLYRGENGFAGEIGHNRTSVAMSEMDTGRQIQCSCGGVNCLELFATESMALGHLAELLAAYNGYSPAKTLMNGGLITQDILREAYRAGDSIVTRYIEAIAASIAAQLSATVNLVDPELIILGGGFIWDLPELKDLIERELKRSCLVPIRNRISVRTSALGENASLQGSALQLINHYLDN